MSKQTYYVPITPGGTAIMSGKALTKQRAILNLMRAAKHMPYKNWHEFAQRGYTIKELEL